MSYRMSITVDDHEIGSGINSNPLTYKNVDIYLGQHFRFLVLKI